MELLPHSPVPGTGGGRGGGRRGTLKKKRFREPEKMTEEVTSRKKKSDNRVLEKNQRKQTERIGGARGSRKMKEKGE